MGDKLKIDDDDKNPLADAQKLGTLCNAFARLIVYVVIWRRLHLTDETLVSMTFYNDDWIWLIPAAALLVVSVTVLLIKYTQNNQRKEARNRVQNEHIIFAVFGVIFALFFVISAVHHHNISTN